MRSQCAVNACATFRDVEKYKLRDVPTSHSIDSTEPHWSAVLWGPVSREAALAAGCVTASSSILLKPADSQGSLPPQNKQPWPASIPKDIYTLSSDDSKSLAARLKRCTFLDEIKSKWAGHGRNGRRVALNSTDYSQPRRATFSVTARDSVLIVCVPRPNGSMHTRSTAARQRISGAGRCRWTCSSFAWCCGRLLGRSRS